MGQGGGACMHKRPVCLNTTTKEMLLLLLRAIALLTFLICSLLSPPPNHTGGSAAGRAVTPRDDGLDAKVRVAEAKGCMSWAERQRGEDDLSLLMIKGRGRGGGKKACWSEPTQPTSITTPRTRRCCAAERGWGAGEDGSGQRGSMEILPSRTFSCLMTALPEREIYIP